jgi:hypothetical protein
LIPNNNSSNSESWTHGVNNPDIFASIMTSSKRVFYSNSTFGSNVSAYSNYLPSYFLSKYNGYLNFGGTLEHWQ